MIRKLKTADLDKIMSIWLNANIEAHSFIAAEYWKEHFEAVKKMIPQAEVFVSERDDGINGFIGLSRTYVEGIFVDKAARSKGIGSELLDFVKKDRARLSLKVYKKNESAVQFYKNRGFRIDAESLDTDTSEEEYIMAWERNGKT